MKYVFTSSGSPYQLYHGKKKKRPWYYLYDTRQEKEVLKNMIFPALITLAVAIPLAIFIFTALGKLLVK
jgi:hypothetical protein